MDSAIFKRIMQLRTSRVNKILHMWDYSAHFSFPNTKDAFRCRKNTCLNFDLTTVAISSVKETLII